MQCSSSASGARRQQPPPPARRSRSHLPAAARTARPALARRRRKNRRAARAPPHDDQRRQQRHPQPPQQVRRRRQGGPGQAARGEDLPDEARPQLQRIHSKTLLLHRQAEEGLLSVLRDRAVLPAVHDVHGQPGAEGDQGAILGRVKRRFNGFGTVWG